MRGGYYSDPLARRRSWTWIPARRGPDPSPRAEGGRASFLRAAMCRGECPRLSTRSVFRRPLPDQHAGSTTSSEPGCLAPSHGPRQRCFSPGIDGVHVCPVREQDRHDVDEPRLQRRSVAPTFGVELSDGDTNPFRKDNRSMHLGSRHLRSAALCSIGTASPGGACAARLRLALRLYSWSIWTRIIGRRRGRAFRMYCWGRRFRAAKKPRV